MAFIVEFDDHALAQLQAQANAAGQAVIRQVNAEMSGQSVAKVAAALRARLHAAGLKPDEQDVNEIAQAISAGTLTE